MSDNAQQQAATTEVPYGGLLGVGPYGVPAFSNGHDEYFSAHRHTAPDGTVTGYEWQCVEYARRFLLSLFGLKLRETPTAAGIWLLDSVTGIDPPHVVVPLQRFDNGSTLTMPARGDLVVWGRSAEVPFGHVAVVAEVAEDQTWLGIAEQNSKFTKWTASDDASSVAPASTKTLDNTPPAAGPPTACTTKPSFAQPHGPDFGRKLSIQNVCGRLEVVDPEGDPILGWMRVAQPRPSEDHVDYADRFRFPLTPGRVERRPLIRDMTLPWITASNFDFFLKRSLVGRRPTKRTVRVPVRKQLTGSPEGTAPAAVEDSNAVEAEVEVDPESGLAVDPSLFEWKDVTRDIAETAEEIASSYYVADHDFLIRIRQGSNEMHHLFLETTRALVMEPSAATTQMLIEKFALPEALHGLLRKSLEIPCCTGRFDFGYDGTDLKVMEYNADSSTALLEACDTQEKMAQHYGFDHLGTSSGTHLNQHMVKFWTELAHSPLRPKGGVVHFMVDDNDEEWYTALTMMRAAQAAGFECQLCVNLVDFRFKDDSQVNAPGQVAVREVVDLKGRPVEMVWKTWAWPTVLKDFKARADNAGVQIFPPSVSESMDYSGPDDSAQSPPQGIQAMTPSLSEILLRDDVVVFEPFWKTVTGSKALLPYVYQRAPGHPNLLPAAFSVDPSILTTTETYVEKPVHGRGGRNVTIRENGAEAIKTEGQFEDEVTVYQDRITIKQFDGYHPIFCGWVVGNAFGGLTIREDKSRVTQLESAVVPLRIVRW